MLKSRGSESVGAVVSTTMTGKLPVEPSEPEHETVVVPIGKRESEAGEQVTVSAGRPSLPSVPPTTLTVNPTNAPVGPSASALTLEGRSNAANAGRQTRDKARTTATERSDITPPNWMSGTINKLGPLWESVIGRLRKQRNTALVEIILKSCPKL
jgi:hypothetical protein